MFHKILNSFATRSPKTGYPNTPGVVWHHLGVMRNPLTGAEVVGVEGIELVVPLPSEVFTNDPNDTEITKTSKNIIKDVPLFSESYLTSKIFVYVDGKNRSQAITSFRVRPPHSPSRQVNPIKEIHQLVTIGLNEQGKLYSKVGFPGGRTIESKRIKISSKSITNSEEGPKDSTALSIRPSFRFGKADLLADWKNPSFEVIQFVSAKKKKTINRFISFQSPGNDISGRSQEYYTIQLIPQTLSKLLKGLGLGLGRKDQPSQPTAKMIYKRYGECPPWYSVAKATSMEIQALRYNCLAELPLEVLERFLEFEEETVSNKASSDKKKRSRFFSKADTSDQTPGKYANESA